MIAAAQGVVTVRPLDPEDVDRLVELGERMHAEGAFAFLPFDREKVRLFALRYAAPAPDRLGLVAELDGRLIGMFAGRLAEYFFCHEKIASDMLLYIEPEARGSTAAGRLMRAYRAWAIERSAREVCLGTSNQVQGPATGRFYEVMGFHKAGALYKERLR
jgi:GNAT superfamily N-acetyltransferase